MYQDQYTGTISNRFGDCHVEVLELALLRLARVALRCEGSLIKDIPDAILSRIVVDAIIAAVCNTNDDCDLIEI